MSYLNPVNPDALTMTPDNVARGPRLGFLGALESSFEDQTRYGNMFGRGIATLDEEAANAARIQSKGEVAPPVLDPGGAFAVWTGAYDNAANVYNAMDPRPADAMFGAREARLKELQGKYPDLGVKTYGGPGGIFDTVQKKAEAARFRAQADTTFAGGIGRFIGSAAGFLDPRTNPLAVAALPLAAPEEIGGIALGAGVRIAAEGLIQAGVQAAQTPGIQANQRALGGNPTPEEAALGVLFAGLGGAAFRGIGEAVGARWFAKGAGDTETPPPPPTPSLEAAAVQRRATAQTIQTVSGVDAFIGRIEGIEPTVSALANTRLGRIRLVTDIDHAAERLASWSELPSEITPPTSMRLPGLDPVTNPPVIAQAAGETVDEIARRIDPQVFTIYDKLATRLQQVQAILTRIDTPEARAAMAAQETVDTAIASARAKVAAATTAKQTERAQAELDALTASRGPMTPTRPEAVLHAHTSSGIVGRRAELERLNAQINDLRPVVQRAYARAQNKWDVYENQRAQIKSMMDEAKPTLGPNVALDTAIEGSSKIFREAPAGSMVRTESLVIPGELKDFVDTSTKITAEAAAKFSPEVEKALSPDNADKLLRVPGSDMTLHLDNDKLFVPDDTGGKRVISVRQLLEEAREDADTLKAVSSCGGIGAK